MQPAALFKWHSRGSADLHLRSRASCPTCCPVAQQQQRLLDARFGPREVESLAINAIVPAPEDGKDDEEGDEEDEEEGVPGGGTLWHRQQQTRGAGTQQRCLAGGTPYPALQVAGVLACQRLISALTCKQRALVNAPNGCYPWLPFLRPLCSAHPLGAAEGDAQPGGAARPVRPLLLVRWARVCSPLDGQRPAQHSVQRPATPPSHPTPYLAISVLSPPFLPTRYFIESAEIGPITLNVTVSLSSRLLSTATRNTAPKVGRLLGGAWAGARVHGCWDRRELLG